MKVTTLNVRGDLGKKINYLDKYLPNMHAIALQETHTTKDTVNSIVWAHKNKWHFIWSHGETNSRGVAILLNKQHYTKPPTNIKTDKEGRWVWCKAEDTSGTTIILGSVYTPHTHNNCTEYLDKLELGLPENTPALIGGDWNTTLYKGEKSNDSEEWKTTKQTRALKNFAERHSLEDTSNKAVPQFTFRARNSELMERLDRWLYKGNTEEWKWKAGVILFPWSDHDASTIQRVEGKRSTNLWKLNTSILKSPTAVKAVQEVWSNRKEATQRTTDPMGWWEDTKLAIRAALITASTKMSAERTAKRKDLYKKVSSAKSREEREAYLHELKTLEENRIQGALIRARKKWHSARDRPTPHTLRKLATKRNAQRIEAIKWKGERHTNTTNIVKAAEEYYSQLFAEKETKEHAQDWLLSKLPRKLSKKAAEKLDRPVSDKEIRAAMKDSPKGKAPGMDGMPIEVYRILPGIEHGVLDMWDAAVDKGALPNMTKMGKLIILHKKKDREDLSNYRPLTLMNSDYKIIAKALASRLAKVTAEVVGKQQAGFIRGRRIKFNVIEAHLVTKHHNTGTGGAIVLLDFEKAYDRVNREWLWKTMNALGFGENFIQMMQVLHNRSTIVLCLNSEMSGSIAVESGVRQGCPIAPLLFAISTEPLRNVACEGLLHKGIITLGVHSTTSMYADDTTGYVADEQDLRCFMLEMSIYQLASGAALNLEKSSIIFLGEKFECGKLEVIEKNKFDRLLGFMISTDAKEEEVQKHTLDKFLDRCSKWKESSLCLAGKVAMVRVFAESTLEYTAPFHTYSGGALKTIKSAYWKAIYGTETTTRLAFDKATHHTKKGGLGALNIEARLGAHLALWIPQAEEHAEEAWAKLFTRARKCGRPNDPKDVVQRAWHWWGLAKDKIKKPVDTPWKVKWIYKALIPEQPKIPPKLKEIAGVEWENNWAYLDNMPVRGKVGEIRWRNWLCKLKVKTNNNTPNACECGNVGDSEHVLNACPIAHGMRDLTNKILAPIKVKITKGQWNRDWIRDNFESPEAGAEETADIVMTAAKTTLWRRYTNAHYGEGTSTGADREGETQLWEEIRLASHIAEARSTPKLTKVTLKEITKTTQPTHQTHN